MHRNTYLLVVFLAIFAALVVGVNIGKRVATPAQLPSTITPTPTEIAMPSGASTLFENTSCGISLQYPDTLTLMNSASGSALLIDKVNTDQSIAITCQKDIPRSALPDSKIETLRITNADGTASVSAKLYHDASPKDGTAIDQLIFYHPKTGMDVYIAGFGVTFDGIIQTIKLLP